MERSPVDFTLPVGPSWTRLLDTQRWFDFDDPSNASDFFDSGKADPSQSHNISLDTEVAVDGGVYGVADSSIVVLRAAEVGR
jgi:hypothetical protein